MKKMILTGIIGLFAAHAFAQSNYEKFKRLFDKNDTLKINKLLADWGKATPNDPELYTCAISYYFSNSRKEIIAVTQGQPQKDGFKLTDSTGKTTGYLGSDIGYHREKLKKDI